MSGIKCPADQIKVEHFLEYGEEDLNKIPYVVARVKQRRSGFNLH